MIEKHKKHSTSNLKNLPDILENQIRTMHSAFLDRYAEQDNDSITSDKFVDFISKQTGGKNLLRKVHANNVKIYFDDIQEQGMMVAHIREHQDKFRSTDLDQASTMDHAYGAIKKYLNTFPGKWDDFVNDHHLYFSSTINGISLTDRAKSKTTIRTMYDLYLAWTSFLSKHSLSADHAKDITDKIDQYTSEEHIMVRAIFEKVRTKISPDVRGDFDNHIGGLDAYSTIQTVGDITDAIDNWLTIHPQEKETIDDVIISNRDIYKTYQRMGGSGNLDGDFSERDPSLSQLIDRNSSLAIASTYNTSANYIRDAVAKSQQKMSVFSPTLASLMEQYPTDQNTLRSARPEYNNTIDKLQQQHKTTLDHTQTSEGDDRTRAKAAQESLHYEIEILKRNAWVESIRTQDEKLATLLEKGPSLDFDFSQLSKEDQCYLGWCCARINIENRDEKNNIYNLDYNRYSQFVRDMFDPHQDSIVLPTDNGESVTIPVRDKGFLAGGIHPSQFAFDSLEECRHLGFGIDVTVTNENEKALHTMFPHLFQSINKQTIAPSYKVRIVDKYTGEADEGYLMNIGYTGDNIIHEGKNIKNSTATDQWMLFDMPPTKAGRKYPNPRLIRNGRNLGENMDAYDIDVLDKNLTLTGDSMDQLTLGWALGDKMQYPQHPNHSLDHSRNDMMDDMRTPEPDNYIDNYTREQQQADDSTDSVEAIQANFLEEFKKNTKAPRELMSTINALDDLVGQTLWIHHKESNVPPKTVPFWLMLHIDDIDSVHQTITFTMRGSDNEISGSEGESYTLPLESKTLRQIESGADDKTIHMMPSYEGQIMGAYLDTMQEAGLIEKENASLFGGLELTKNGFKRTSDGKEVAYFATKGSISDPNNKGNLVDVPYAFRVERSGNDFVITNKELSYNKKVNFATLLLFVGNRNLQAMTKEEKNNFDDRTIHPKKYELASKDADARQGRAAHVGGWYGIANMVSFVKTGWQGLQDGLDSYNKKEDEDMSEVLLGKYELYGKLAKGFARWPGAKSAFSNMHGDYMQERDKKIFDLINGSKEYLSQNPDGEYVTKTEVLGFLDDAAVGKLPTKRRDVLFAAGAYLYMLEDHGDAYGATLAPYRGSGLRVKILCGQAHYENYLQEAEAIRLKLEADPTNANLQEEYAEMEHKYIHKTISDNSSFKTFFSKKYSDAIIGSKRKGNDQERIDKTANVFGNQKDFDLNETLFGVKIRNGDIGKTIGHLKAMAMTAQSSTQINKVRMYLLELMLSGMVLYQTKDSTKNILVGIASKMGFMPGTWVKDANHPQKIHTLLDYITGGSFSSETGYSSSMFQRLNYGEKIGEFHGKFKKWANGSHGNKVSKFVTLMDINDNPDTNLLAILGKYHNGEHPVHGPTPGTHTNEKHISILHDIKNGIMNNNVASADRDLQNKYLFTAPLAIPNSVIDSQLSPNSQGQLESGNNKETGMKEQFWKSLSHSIPAMAMPESERFFIEKFVALLPRITGHNFMKQALLSAQYHLHRNQKGLAEEILRDTMEVVPLINNMNNLDEPIKNTLNRYVDFFVANLGNIKENELAQALNLSTSRQQDGLSIANRYIPGRDRDKKEHEIPKDTLNKQIFAIKKRLTMSGQGWHFFGGNHTTNDTSSNSGFHITQTNPDLIPVENPDIYKPFTPKKISQEAFDVLSATSGRDISIKQAEAQKRALEKHINTMKSTEEDEDESEEYLPEYA